MYEASDCNTFVIPRNTPQSGNMNELLPQMNILEEFGTGLFLFSTDGLTKLNGQDLDLPDNVTLPVRSSCTIYESLANGVSNVENIDRKWLSSIVVQGASWFVGWLVIAQLVFSSCCACHPVFLQCASVLLNIAIILQGLVFLVMQSKVCTDNPVLNIYFRPTPPFENKCQLGSGATKIIWSIILYFMAMILCFLIRPAKKVDKDDEYDDKEIAELEEQRNTRRSKKNDDIVTVETGDLE
jgi:hypothetical protein